MYTIDQLIARQERGIEILEAIKSFERRIQLRNESLNGFAGTFPSLAKKYTNDIDTMQRCIDRLFNKFNNLYK